MSWSGIEVALLQVFQAGDTAKEEIIRKEQSKYYQPLKYRQVCDGKMVNDIFLIQGPNQAYGMISSYS